MPGNALKNVRSQVDELIRNKQKLIKILSIALILMLALLLKVSNSDKSDISIETSVNNTESELAAPETDLYVDIGGAVVNPGVYKVKPGTRLYEVIELAGGLRDDADTYSVNQAAFVEDGAKFIIPVAGEENGGYLQGVNSSLVNINTADKSQLSSLPGIGDVIADRIIEYRTTNRFKTKEELMSVKGIGNSIYCKIEQMITI